MDREKIINQLETDYREAERRGWILVPVGRKIVKDAIALLKEQEAKPMIENEREWNCPSCGMKLIGKTANGYPCDLIDLPEDEPIHFCPMCGQAVKWNE